MNPLRSPRNKLILASALLVVLAAAARAGGFQTMSLARCALGAGALAGCAVWIRRSKSAVEDVAPRLRVLSRAGLSQRCSLALVEADGQTFLVAYGDGFAELGSAPLTKEASR